MLFQWTDTTIAYCSRNRPSGDTKIGRGLAEFDHDIFTILVTQTAKSSPFTNYLTVDLFSKEGWTNNVKNFIRIHADDIVKFDVNDEFGSWVANCSINLVEDATFKIVLL